MKDFKCEYAPCKCTVQLLPNLASVKIGPGYQITVIHMCFYSLFIHLLFTAFGPKAKARHNKALKETSYYN